MKHQQKFFLFIFTSIELRIKNRLVFKIKDGHYLELQTPKTIKLFGSTKKLIEKTKNEENVPSLEVLEVELVLVQYNLVDHQYQQKYEVLYTFTSNKSYAYLLNVESNTSVFRKNYYTEEIIITFTDQNGRPLEV